MSDWIFEVAATTQPTGWDDPALVATGAEAVLIAPSSDHGGDTVWTSDGKGKLSEFDLMVFGAPEDEDATPIDDIDVNHPRDDDEDDRWWDEPNTGGDGPSGDGDGGIAPDDGGGEGQVPNPLAQWGLDYLLSKMADWLLDESDNGAGSPRLNNFDPDDIDIMRLSGDRVFASTDNGKSWYVDLDRSAADGWESHVKFDDNGFPWVDLGDGAGYRLAPVGWTGS